MGMFDNDDLWLTKESELAAEYTQNPRRESNIWRNLGGAMKRYEMDKAKKENDQVVERRKAIITQINRGSPKDLMRAAQMFNQLGDFQGAQWAIDQAKSIQQALPKPVKPNWQEIKTVKDGVETTRFIDMNKYAGEEFRTAEPGSENPQYQSFKVDDGTPQGKHVVINLKDPDDRKRLEGLQAYMKPDSDQKKQYFQYELNTDGTRGKFIRQINADSPPEPVEGTVILNDFEASNADDRFDTWYEYNTQDGRNILTGNYKSLPKGSQAPESDGATVWAKSFVQQNRSGLAGASIESGDFFRFSNMYNTRAGNASGVLKDIQEIKALISSGGAVSDKGIQSQMTQVFGSKVRALAELENWKNFGGLVDRIEGTFNRLVTGEYSDDQKAEILRSMSDYEKLIQDRSNSVKLAVWNQMEAKGTLTNSQMESIIGEPRYRYIWRPRKDNSGIEDEVRVDDWQKRAVPTGRTRTGTR